MLQDFTEPLNNFHISARQDWKHEYTLSYRSYPEAGFNRFYAKQHLPKDGELNVWTCDMSWACCEIWLKRNQSALITLHRQLQMYDWMHSNHLTVSEVRITSARNLFLWERERTAFYLELFVYGCRSRPNEKLNKSDHYIPDFNIYLANIDMSFYHFHCTSYEIYLALN